MGMKIGDSEYQNLVAAVFKPVVIRGEALPAMETIMAALLEARPLDTAEKALWADVQEKIRERGTAEQVSALDDLLSSYAIYRSLVGPSMEQTRISHPLLTGHFEARQQADVDLVVSDFRGLEMTASRRVTISPQITITDKEETIEIVLDNEFFTSLVHDDRFFMIMKPEALDFGLIPALDRPTAANFFPNRKIPSYVHTFPAELSHTENAGRREALFGLPGTTMLLRSVLEELGFAKDRAVFHDEITIDPALRNNFPKEIANASNLRGYSIELYEEETWDDLIPNTGYVFPIEDIPFNPALSPELAETLLDNVITMAETLKSVGITVSAGTWLYLGFDLTTGQTSFDVSAIPTLLDSTLLAKALGRFDGLAPASAGYYFPNLAAFSTGNTEMMQTEKVLIHIITQLTRLARRHPPDIDHVTELALREFDRFLAFNGFEEQANMGNGRKKLVADIIRYYLKTLDFRGLMEFMTMALLPMLKEKDPVLLIHASRLFIDEAANRADEGDSVADFWFNNAGDLWSALESPEPKKGGGGHSSGSEPGNEGGFGGLGGLGGGCVGQASGVNTAIIPQNMAMAGGAGLYIPTILGANMMPASIML